MTLFFKHLCKSTRQRPLQPLLLIITLALAVSTSIFSYTVEDALAEEAEWIQAAQYGDSDLSVALTGSSGSRFMFASDIEDLLGKEITTVGCLELPVFVGEHQETVAGVATDFERVGHIFDLRFSEYGSLPPSAVPHSAFVSADFAEMWGLSVGDQLDAVAFGTQKTYTVAGISNSRFMESYDVMVDIRGIVRIMAEDSLLISAVSDRLQPATAIYVKLAEGQDPEACAKILMQDARFADKNVILTSNLVRERMNTQDMSTVVDVLILVSVVLCAAVVFCCFFILSAQRVEENFIFSLSGASPVLLCLAQYVEVFGYWLVGSGLGTVLSIPMVQSFIHSDLFSYAADTIHPLTVLKSALLMLGILLLTVGTFLFAQRFRDKRRAGHKAETRLAWCSVLTCTALFAVLSILPAGTRFPCFLFTCVLLVLSLFLCVPPLMRWLMERWNGAWEARILVSFEATRNSLRYALKNVCTVKILHNISRLVAVLTCILLMMATVVSGTLGFIDCVQTVFDADYAVINATESCYEKVLQCDGAERSTRAFFSKTNLISVEDKTVLSGDLRIERLPVGNEAIVTSGYAEMKGLNVGERFCVTYGVGEYEVEVIEIVDFGYNFILFDCAHFGVAYNAVMVKGKADVSDDQLLSEISNRTALELVAIRSVDSLLQEKIGTIWVYFASGMILTGIVLVFALIGTLDSLCMSYRARRDEFAFYSISGMTQESIRHMKCAEILLTFAFGILLGVLGGVVAAFAMEKGLVSFGYRTFYNVWMFLK
ncbi:MAG: ABC transporter permease [Clostridia bacterium]|nr:ABC transporter permease [Clostridia bacterium]